FCGDALGFISDDMPDMPMPVGLPPFDPDAYLQTIVKLAALAPSVVFYAHHRPRTNAGPLIERLKETLLAFCAITKMSLQAGEDEQRISERVLEHLRRFLPEARLPVIVEASVSGYASYFRNRM
ncbi:MAG: hypothetical protein NTU41_10635, partial [Chloroflexi bacterium]|nr:hypothetical protein [Chloroflexota bacterium]